MAYFSRPLPKVPLMPDLECPPIDPALPDYLSTLYPDRCPDETMSERAVWMAAGAASLIRKLRALSEEQLEDILATPNVQSPTRDR